MYGKNADFAQTLSARGILKVEHHLKFTAKTAKILWFSSRPWRSMRFQRFV
jgi:hypothetical protein